MPAKVDELFDEVKSTNPNYTDEQAWATAWSIYCKHVEPGSDSCHLPTSEYLKGKTAMQRQAGTYEENARKSKENELKSVLDRTRQAFQTARTLLGEINFAGLPEKEQKKAEKLAHEIVDMLYLNLDKTKEQLEGMGVRTAATAQRVAARFLRADRKDDEEWQKINAEIMEYQRVLKIYEKMLADLDAQTKNVPDGGLDDWRGLRSGVLKNIEDTKAQIKKLSDHLSHSYLLKSRSRGR